MRGRRRRVSLVLQMSATECGAACLAMVYGVHGVHLTTRTIRRQTGLGRDGLSALQLKRHALGQGLTARGLRITEPRQLSHITLPCIAFWAQAHCIVVERCTARSVTIVDPASGRVTLSRAQFLADFTGVVLEIAAPAGFAPAPPEPELGSMRQLLRFAWAQARGALLIAAGTAVLTQLAGVAAAHLSGLLLDRALHGTAAGRAELLGVVAGFLGALAVVTAAQSLVTAWLLQRLDRRLGERFFRKICRLPFAFYQLRSAGDLLARLASNGIARDMVSTRLVASAVDASFVLIFVGYLCAVSAAFCLLTLALCALSTACVLALRSAMRSANRREISADALVQAFAIDVIRGMEQLAAAQQMGAVYRAWEHKFRHYLGGAAARRALDATAQWSVSFFTMASPLLLLVLGAALVQAGQLSVGQVVTLSILAGFVLRPVAQLLALMRDLQGLRVHLDRVHDVLDEDDAGPEPPRSGPAVPAVAVDLHGVGYRYPGSASPAVLADISLHVAPGQSLGVVGASGSGKTTLLRLIAGLVDPVAGRLRITPEPRALPAGSVGVVTQDATFFGTSIRENLLFGVPADRRPGDAELLAVLQSVHLAQTVRGMPLGLDTPLADGGSFLSGGERQRVALARALIWRPALLLLDEATSSLDSATEASIAATIAALAVTRIICTHRLSTIAGCDTIVVLSHGRIVESGTHPALMAGDGAYAALVRAQRPRRAA